MDLAFRPATMDDAAALFEWRNDPLTREMSFTTDPVAWDGHIGWLEKRLARPDPGLYIVMDKQNAVGTFRVDDDAIGYTVAPAYRRMGYATRMLAMVRGHFGPLRAEIKPQNTASIKAAHQAGLLVELKG